MVPDAYVKVCAAYIWFKGLKVWWQYATLFVLFLYFITFIQYNHPITFIQYIRRGLSPSPHRLWLSGKDLPVVPSRESNSGLPSSKPTRYQLSHAAPCYISGLAIGNRGCAIDFGIRRAILLPLCFLWKLSQLYLPF
jgi:hypothetical protein